MCESAAVKFATLYSVATSSNQLLYFVKQNCSKSNPQIATKEWLGRGRDGFTVAVLPISVVCRQSCSKKLEQWYYVWHKGGSKNRDGKMKYASKVRDIRIQKVYKVDIPVAPWYIPRCTHAGTI